MPFRAGTDIVVNATSIGLGNGNEPLDIDVTSLKPGMVVADVIVDPPDTRFLRDARAQGCTAIDGLGMLINQGVIGVKYWTGHRCRPGRDARGAGGDFRALRMAYSLPSSSSSQLRPAFGQRVLEEFREQRKAQQVIRRPVIMGGGGLVPRLGPFPYVVIPPAHPGQRHQVDLLVLVQGIDEGADFLGDRVVRRGLPARSPSGRPWRWSRGRRWWARPSPRTGGPWR